MRIACGLPEVKPKEGRASNTSVALRQAVESDGMSSQIVAAASNPLVEQCVHKIVRHMLTQPMFSVTPLAKQQMMQLPKLGMQVIKHLH